ncbi:DUF6682 family protein [Caballeronia sp. LZ034LL]|uniref:phage adaptor protein n=1 Tax=Caballeronia sp. LZ034LL TaxID=3038567 RepID=UPI002861911D|nr:DUF6682 family protein [Caballeronia sp. LZ034LL]MDR5839332.1 hypothetical protein [Caballeronia sp. LZ034LL]
MNIAELFADLSFGELSILHWAGEGNGTITDAGKERLIRFANDGLLKLYTRFLLKENDVLIELKSWITNYHLDARFAVSQGEEATQPFLYIRDMPLEKFSDDVIRILAVFNSYGYQYPLNDDGNPHSLFTPQGKVLQVPHPQDGVVLSVSYQAKHPTLTLADLTQEIELPEVLVPALRDWIGYRAFGQMKTQEALAMAQTHQAQYEAACAEVVQQDLVSTSTSTTNERFNKNGWI